MKVLLIKGVPMMSEFKEVKALVGKAISLKKNKKYQDALQILLAGRDEYPDNNYLKSSLADLYMRMNRLGEAEELVEQVLLENAENYHALTVRGNLAFQKRAYHEALQYFMDAYRLKQTDYLAYRLTRTHLALNELEQALSLCQQILEKDKDNQWFKKLEAEIYKKMDQSDKASSTLDEYLSNEQEDLFAFKELVELKLKDRPAKEAAAELRRFLKIKKYQENIYLQSLLAEKLQENGNFVEAMDVYQEALKRDPENSYLRKNLAMALYKNDSLEEALNLLEGIFREDPNDYYVRSTLEYIYKHLGREKEGREFFKAVIKETGLNNLWGIVKRLARGVEDSE
jgi:predicted Zn-dependent protease